jgi:uncharacterized protein YdeI (YjbR/CyaY-like superfamily)
MPEPTGIRFFAEPDEFRAWLVEFHESARELWVGFYKKGSGKPSITWPQSVDEALCFGWIDGIRKSLGKDAYVIRFTPRKRDSIWSNVNIARYEALRRSERMDPAGLQAYEARDEKKSGSYLFERRENPKLTAAELKQFRAKAAAWKFFQAQPPGYRRLAAWWVISAKRPETRKRRLALLIKDSAEGQRIGALRQVTK